MTKLYCYVDESGTGSVLFAVAVVITSDSRDDLVDVCQRIEIETGKGRTKWSKASYEKRLAYLRAIVNDERFKNTLCYAIFDQVNDFDYATVLAIARAIEHADPTGGQKIVVFVDGLNDKKRREYSTQVRGRVSSFVEIRGVHRDESNALIRLADAVAGFVRDAQDKDSSDVVALFERAKRTGVIVQV